jgi:phenylacetate-CoA ligase
LFEKVMKVVPEYWDEGLECMSPEELRELRTLRMHKHLRYTYQNSSFYRRRFDEYGIKPEEIVSLEDFQSRIPFLQHKEVIENQKIKPPFGEFLSVGLKDVARIYCSPGPFIMPFSKEDMDSYINATANGLYICGARRGDIVDISYAYQWDLAGTMLDDGFRRLGCAVVPGGPGMSKTHVLVMRHLGVTVLRAFPSFALKLAETAKKMDINPRRDLKIRLIIIGGEIYGEREKGILGEEFGAEIREMYGWAETGFVAAECREGGGMHCFSDSILEIVDPVTGKPVLEGEGGEIVTTDLTRKAMPLIRYRTGDFTEGFNTEPCLCGRTSPRLKRVIHRSSETLRIRGVHLTVEMIEEIFKRHVGIGKFQAVIDKDGYREQFLLKVESADLQNKRRIKQILADDLRAATRLRAEIDVVPHGSIAKNEPTLLDKRISHK